MVDGNPKWGECRRGGVFLRLPIPATAWVLQNIRRNVPPHKRRWDDLTKMWWINDTHIDKVESILREHYPNYDPYQDG